jgi:hypothetical protein
VVSGDVTATANNIMASESLWRISIASELILLVCAVPLTLILYVLLRPMNNNLALLAVFFNIVEFPIEATSKLCLFAALFLSGNADYLKAFEPHQLHALVKVSLKLHDYGFGIDLVFFGFACLVYGYGVEGMVHERSAHEITARRRYRHHPNPMARGRSCGLASQ